MGGGPAGCSAAHALAGSDLEVVLLESGDHYRDKPCGDALISIAVERLKEIGLDRLELARLGGRPFSEVRLYRSDKDKKTLTIAHPGGWVVRRAQLDQALRDLVGMHCEVRYRSVVREILPIANGVNVKIGGKSSRCERFDAVILATGASSKLSRELGLHGFPGTGVSIRTYARENEPDESLDFHFAGAPLRGYLWRFPVAKDQVNVGLWLTEHRNAKHLKHLLLAELRRMHLGVACQIRGGIGPLWSGAADKWHSDFGIVSCGDAAGLVDPMTGEGISAALFSGAIAGRSIAEYIKRSRDTSALQGHSEQLRSYFRTRYALNPLRAVFSDHSGELLCNDVSFPSR